jgi:cell division septation protein DedD
MSTNDNGEFELVLGNRQLLSGFFIVALLFGVAFAMGYIVGRNSLPSAKLQAESAAKPAGSAIGDRPPAAAPATPSPASDSPGTADSPPAADAASQGAAAETHPDETQPTTQPARDTVAAAPETSPAAPAPVNDPAPGTYWQVLAAQQHEADAVMRALVDKGLPASLSPGPNGLTRVLVGPYNDTQSLGRAKSALEDAGFHPILKR